jgi:hypothetical protein
MVQFQSVIDVSGNRTSKMSATNPEVELGPENTSLYVEIPAKICIGMLSIFKAAILDVSLKYIGSLTSPCTRESQIYSSSHLLLPTNPGQTLGHNFFRNNSRRTYCFLGFCIRVISVSSNTSASMAL